MRRLALLASALLAGAFTTTFGVPAALAAAAPVNDVLAGAVAITTLPFDTTVDTTGATTDSDDAAVNATCGAPATEASVWYSYAATSSDELLVDVSASSYSAGVIIAHQDAGVWAVDGCGPGTTAAQLVDGTLYYVLAFGDVAGGGGGSLVLHADLVHAPTVTATVDPVGTVNRAGEATISGTYTCDAGNGGFITVGLRQNVGRFSVTGWSSDVFTSTCDGSPQPWSRLVHADNGKFAGGRASADTFLEVCNGFVCTDVQVTAAVRLRGAAGPA